jgi:hypothetical protein
MMRDDTLTRADCPPSAGAGSAARPPDEETPMSMTNLSNPALSNPAREPLPASDWLPRRPDIWLDDREDPLRPARGIANAMLFSAPFWAAGAWLLLQWLGD